MPFFLFLILHISICADLMFIESANVSIIHGFIKVSLHSGKHSNVENGFMKFRFVVEYVARFCIVS